ncbi:MAG TPA: hypothetical protein VML75_02970 [Kofleriaceae bacterium]|nr:hypothetical protein [Kofleriaceae bacterium]
MRTSVCLMMVLLSACTLGESRPDGPSPYENAEISVVTPIGVADGDTPIEVTITGEVGAKLALVSSAGAAFVAPDDPEAPTEKTVFLTDVGGMGQAVVGLVSAQVGTATVGFKPDPLRTLQHLEFVPVRMAVGLGNEVRTLPGLVEHRVCVAVNSPTGTLRASNLVGGAEGSGAIQAAAMVGPLEPVGLGCPSTAVDQVGWQGYAIMLWHTSADSAELDLTYVGPGGTDLAIEVVTLEGLAFPGYEVTVEALEGGIDYVAVDVTVYYAAAGDLPSGPAAGVAVEQRFIPSPGPDFLGSSSGDADAVPTTDSAGVVTMFFDPLASGTYAWFALLSGGINVQLDDLEIP